MVLKGSWIQDPDGNNLFHHWSSRNMTQAYPRLHELSHLILMEMKWDSKPQSAAAGPVFSSRKMQFTQACGRSLHPCMGADVLPSMNIKVRQRDRRTAAQCCFPGRWYSQCLQPPFIERSWLCRGINLLSSCSVLPAAREFNPIKHWAAAEALFQHHNLLRDLEMQEISTAPPLQRAASGSKAMPCPPPGSFVLLHECRPSTSLLPKQIPALLGACSQLSRQGTGPRLGIKDSQTLCTQGADTKLRWRTSEFQIFIVSAAWSHLPSLLPMPAGPWGCWWPADIPVSLGWLKQALVRWQEVKELGHPAMSGPPVGHCLLCCYLQGPVGSSVPALMGFVCEMGAPSALLLTLLRHGLCHLQLAVQTQAVCNPWVHGGGATSHLVI